MVPAHAPDVPSVVRQGQRRRSAWPFHALKLPGRRPPGRRRPPHTFFEAAPSCDSEEMNAVAWSFGSRSGTYLKAERSYIGDVISLIKGWNTFFSQSDTTDPVFSSRGEKR